jgi:prephenate dehydrogenase
MSNLNQTIVVVGLGLIGGSLGSAIRKRMRGARVIGVSRSLQKIKSARRKRLIHSGSTRIRPALRLADLVFVCTPVDTIPKVIAEVDRCANRGTVVTDVGSTKESIVRWAERRRFKNIRFIGSHPMAGSHLTGMEHARPDLFRRAVVFVTPTGKSNPVALKMVSNIWRKLGAKVRLLTYEEHDRIVSEVSHLPHAAASALMNSVRPNHLRFASSGFFDTTRVAQGNPDLWVPIFMTNRRNLIRDLNRFGKKLDRFTAILKKGSQASLRRALVKASSLRSRI